MCISAALMIGSTLLSVGSTYMVGRANAQVANEQLKHDMQVERLRAATESADRLEEYNRMAAQNRVANAVALGGGINFSFEKGIEPKNMEVAQEDVARIDINTRNVIARQKYGIAVNNASVKWNTFAAGAEAVSGFAGTVGTRYLNNAPLKVTART